MRLGVKLLIAFLAVGLVPFMIIGILSLYEANRTLSQQSLNQLVSLREVKKFAVKRYFNNIKTQLLVFSEDPKVAEFMRKSRFFFTGYKTDLAVTDEAMEKMRRELLTTYMKDFVEVLSASDGSELNTLKEAFSKLDGNAIVIQYKYITENENPLKKKEILNRAKEDRTDYTRYHGKFHSTIRNYYKRFAIDDILLIDPDNGNIVYSVQKNIDFGTSLKDGPWAGTKLAEVLQTEMKRPEKESVLLVDYSLYLPAFDTPVGFFATPIFYKNEIIGIAAFRLSVDGINKIMVERAGLGKTGETYLVGSDGLLRSDSKNRGVKDSFRNPELNKVDTIATAAALSGENGAEITDDYMKRRVLCAYSALKIHGLNWALIAQKNLDEAFAMVDRLRFRFMLLATGGFIVILSIVFFISRSIIRPLRRLEHNAEQLSIGNLNETIDTGRRDELGSLARSFAYMRENLKNSFELIDDQKGQYQSIFENAIEGIFQTSRDGDLLRANQAYTKMLGYNSPEEMIKTISNVKEQLYVNPLDRDNFTEPLEETGFVKGFETTHKRKDGSIITVSINAQVINDENGNFRFFQGMIEDISERKRVEEYKIAKEAAELANRVKSEFLANMSHEIRTPMNAIIGMADLALGTELTSKQREYLSVVRSSSRALLTLINDILDFSKIEAGKLEIEAVPFGLRDLLDDVADSFKVQVIKKEIEFVIATSVGAPEGLVGDPLRLRQVLVNLIGNAFKFTEKGQICLEVLPAGQAKGAEVELNFTVSDTGIGIHRDEIDALRDVFTQADASTTRKFGGTGLGLSISNQLIQLMGGSGIGIESELGRGSAFSFNLSFPRYTAGEERDLIVPERIKGLRALIIEDNEASMKVLGQMLEQFGIRNEGAVTAEEGLALLSSEEGARRFGLVFIDWKLPGMDGLSAAEEIKNNETLKDLTIILMSAFGGEQEISEDGNKVVNGFLHKPIKQSTLFDTIMTAFGYTSRPEGLKYLAASEREFEGIRVLLAEDNKANQQVACEVLFQAGFEVDVANNGREALEALRRREYAVVLMDVQMPVMDGYEATRRIRELEGSSQSSIINRQSPIPIIAITASAMKGDREKCLAAGMDDYISKPIYRDELFRVLRKYLKAVGPPADSGLAAGDTAEDHPPLPDLQGIDISEGLRRLGVSWDRFSRLLLRFSGGQTEVFEELRQAVENGDRENVRLLAHSLAGAAGNISATALRKAAKDLEQAAAGDTGGDEAGLPEYSAAMEREFHVIIGSINSLASVDDRTGIKPAPSSRLDLKQLLSYLQKLEPHLKRRYAKESGAIIDEISRLTWPEDLKDNLEELDGLVRKYRLKQAYPVLESIMKRLVEVKGE